MGVLESIKAQLAASGVSSLDITPFLAQVPEQAKGVLLDIAGEDGLITLDELMAALGPVGPGPPEQPAPG